MTYIHRHFDFVQVVNDVDNRNLQAVAVLGLVDVVVVVVLALTVQLVVVVAGASAFGWDQYHKLFIRLVVNCLTNSSRVRIPL